MKNLRLPATIVLAIFVLSAGGMATLYHVQEIRMNLWPSDGRADMFFGPGIAIVASIITLAASFAADYFGRARLLMLALVSAAIGMMWAGAVFDVIPLFASTTLVRGTTGAAIATAIVLFAGQPDRRWIATRIGILYVATQLGVLAAQFAGAFDVTFKTSTNLFAGVAIVCAVILFRVGGGGHIKPLPGRVQPFDVGLYWFLLAGFMAISATNLAMWQWSSELLAGLGGVPYEEIIPWQRGKTASMALGYLVGGLWADRIGRVDERGYARAALAGSMIVTVALVAMLVTNSMVANGILQLLIAFGAGVTLGPVIALVQFMAVCRFEVAGTAAILLAITLSSRYGHRIVGSIFDLMPADLDSAVALKYALVSISPLGFLACAAFVFVGKRWHSNMREALEEATFDRTDVYERRSGDQSHRVFVKKGFNWSAFFLGPVWAWSTGMVRIGFGLLIGNVIINIVLDLTGTALRGSGVFAVAAMTVAMVMSWLIFVGANGNEWRRRSLRAKGFTLSRSNQT